MDYQPSTAEEQEFLSEYNIEAYPRPSLAADIAVFSIREEKHTRKRTGNLQLLLIKRATYPYKGTWALPGGFCHPDEDVEEAARRELYEETGIKNPYMRLMGCYGKSNRDPRGWVVSNTFLSCVNLEDTNLRADSDAWEAQWFSVSMISEENERTETENELRVKIFHKITLQHEEEILTANVQEISHCSLNREYREYELIESENLAFDHGLILQNALAILRREIQADKNLIFNLLPTEFTMGSLRQAYELVLDKKLTQNNFTRDISRYVVPLDRMDETQAHRAAMLYRRKML